MWNASGGEGVNEELSEPMVIISVGLPFLIILVSMTLITLKVRATELRLRRYAIGWHNDATRLKLTIKTGKQALIYIGSFLLCYVWYLVATVAYPNPDREDRDAYFPIGVLLRLFGPLQGVFNAFIFLHSRYERLVEEGGSLHFVRRASQWASSLRISKPLSTTDRRSNHTEVTPFEEEQACDSPVDEEQACKAADVSQEVCEAAGVSPVEQQV